MPCLTPHLRSSMRNGSALPSIVDVSPCRAGRVDEPRLNCLNFVGDGQRYRLPAQGHFRNTAPSRLWYDGDLQPAAGNADVRFERPVPPNPDHIDAILAPEHPVTLVLADHTTDEQQSAVEVEIVTALAARLLRDDGLEPERLAILAPHRAQNNAIARRLRERLSPGAALPIIDTVERLQGAERDVILFSLTTSAP